MPKTPTYHFSSKQYSRNLSLWWNQLGSEKLLAKSVSPLIAEQPTQRGVCPTQDVGKKEAAAFVSLLRACAKDKDLCKGALVHDDILRRGLLDKCSNALITMYAKCGALQKAREMIECYRSQDVFTWTAVIAAYAHKGEGENSLKCFELMQYEGLSPNAVTFACALKACSSIGAIDKGEKIHDEIAKQELLENDIILGNALVDMYAKCGALSKARRVLEELPLRDVIAWNSLITGYVQHAENEQAFNCFEGMQKEGLSPNSVTFTCILKACGAIRAAERGERIHNEIINQRLLENNVVLGTALVDMYAKCGVLSKAQQVLERLPIRNAISWSALLAGYAQQGDCEQALKCYEDMQEEGFFPDASTFSCLLKACASVGAADKGEKIHDDIAKHSMLGDNIVLNTALVDMYAKCGALAKARRLLEQFPLRNVVSWSALIAGYAEQGDGAQALDCFDQMQREGLTPNAVTFICILKACGNIGATDKGEKIHNEIAKLGLLENNVVLGTAVMDMYVKCNALAKARRMLEELPTRNVISWSALIAGYARQGEGEQALSCYELMRRDGLSPDVVTFVCILKACGSIGAGDKGENVHDEIAKQGLLQKDAVLGNALVDMYVKCGALAKARRVLEELPVREVIGWNALIAGYAKQCKGAQVVDCFRQMQDDGHTPDAATFSCMLSACSHLGVKDVGETFFANMSLKYGMTPGLEHHIWMVDILGRSGHLDEAMGVIMRMPSLNGGGWSTLLGACRKWGDVTVGGWAFENAVIAAAS